MTAAQRVRPLRQALDATVDVPPSKAHTLRALFLAALADGKSVIERPLLADDQHTAINALRKLGVPVHIEKGNAIVNGQGGVLKAAKRLDARDSGVTMRFLCALAPLTQPAGRNVVVDGSARMRKRPVQDLIDALKPLGAKLRAQNNNGCPPVQATSGTLAGGETTVRADSSSQFVSALLVALPLAPNDSVVRVVGEKRSWPYVHITRDVQRAFGLNQPDARRDAFHIKGNQSYRAARYKVEGDYSAAAFFAQAAAITGGRVTLNGVPEKTSQADVAFLGFMRQMGCRVKRSGERVTVQGPRELAPIDASVANCPDVAMSLGVTCAFANGTSRLRHVSHLRVKESDRLQALHDQLNAIGARARIENARTPSETLVIEGNPKKLHGARVQTYNDHRIAMSLAIAGLRVPGISIENPACVAKSFPGFFGVLAGLD